MRIEEQVTTVEQSKRLLELGFNPDSASLTWVKSNNDYEDFIILPKIIGNKLLESYCPCWTALDLMSIIKQSIDKCELDTTGYVFILFEDKFGRCESNSFSRNKRSEDNFSYGVSNLFDCLLWLKQWGYIDKEEFKWNE